jgi:hypothetical protein
MATIPVPDYPDTVLRACMQACVSDDVAAMTALLKKHPDLLNTQRLTRVLPGGEGRPLWEHPVGLAIGKGSFAVAELLLGNPAFRIPADCRQGVWVDSVMGEWFGANRKSIEGLCQPGAATHAVPVFGMLCKLGADVFAPVGHFSLSLPLFLRLVTLGVQTGGFFFDIPAYLACCSLKEAPPMALGAVDSLRFWKKKMEHLANKPVKKLREKGKTFVPTRFDKVLPTLIEWLLDAGWQDLGFLDWAQKTAPEALAFRDQAHLAQALPKADLGATTHRL